MKRYLCIFLCVALVAGCKQGFEQKPALSHHMRPVVVELFTSQGCGYCPPADAFLTELAKDNTLLPLSFHVDYWNNWQWQDRFSKPQFTVRQKLYAEQQATSIFTPHMVVDGIRSSKGGNRPVIFADIKHARDTIRSIPVSIKPDNAGQFLVVKIAGRQDGLDMSAFPKPAEIFKLYFSPSETTEVKAGANAGKTVVDVNVVKRMDFIGEWHGDTVFLRIPIEELQMQHMAIIVQEGSMGAVLGVARYPAQ